jgi:hypothetical protein
MFNQTYSQRAGLTSAPHAQLSPLKEQGSTSHEGLVWKAQGTDSLIRPPPRGGGGLPCAGPGSNSRRRVEKRRFRVEQRTLRVELRVKRWTGRIVQWTQASSGPTGRPTHCRPRSRQRPPMRRRGSGGDLRASNRPGRRSPPAPLHTAHAAPADSRRLVGTGQIRSAPSSEDFLCRSSNASRRSRPPSLPQ